MVRSILLALTFVVSVSAFAEAQDVATLVTIARKQTQGVDTLTGASPVTADMVPIGDERVFVVADMVGADKQDPTKSFWLHMRYSLDNGQTWRYAGGLRFTGSADTATTAIIATEASVPASTFIGALFRLEVDVPNRMPLGGTITISRLAPWPQ